MQHQNLCSFNGPLRDISIEEPRFLTSNMFMENLGIFLREIPIKKTQFYYHKRFRHKR